jgi:small subunit ribosomal protein S18
MAEGLDREASTERARTGRTTAEAMPDEDPDKPKGRFSSGKRSRCRFCQDRATRVDYKDVNNLQNLVSAQGKIVSRRRSGNCARHQRMVQKAIKQARYIGLLSYTEGQARGPRAPGRSW